MLNKAHTATVHRIAARWGGIVGRGDEPDILLADGCIEVETSATLDVSVRTGAEISVGDF